MARVWPEGLIGRVMLVLLAAVVLEGAGGVIIYEQFERHQVDDARAHRVIDRAGESARVLGRAPQAERPGLAAALSTPGLAVEWARADAAGGAPARGPLARRVADLAPPELPLGLAVEPGAEPVLRATTPLADGSVVIVRAVQPSGVDPLILRGVLSALVVAGLVAATAAMLVHTLATPLRTLAAVVDGLDAERPTALVERGPRDVRRLVAAFNALQTRIAGMVADRTRSLAAISHDLRTPLSRIRLRTALLPEGDPRRGVEADLDEVEALIDQLLAYIRGETDPERAEPVNLAALVSTVCDAHADLGRDVVYAGPDHLRGVVRPLEVRRALENLIGNALAYAGGAEVSLGTDEGLVRLAVGDRGPGVAETDLPRLAQPFVRLDEARRRATGGAGLGLAIARQAAEREGGRLRLGPRPGGGFLAELLLPPEPAAPPRPLPGR